jgi:serine acetyltransferase
VPDVRPPRISADWRANRGQPHIQLALVLFRLASRARSSRSMPSRVVAPVLAAVYRGYALAVTSIDVPTRTAIGPGLVIRHGFGLVVHADAVIGADVVLRHGVTLGALVGTRGAPRIGDRTEVGSGSQLIGAITIGEDVKIGAGAVVIRDVPAGRTAVGNPARLLGEASA